MKKLQTPLRIVSRLLLIMLAVNSTATAEDLESPVFFQKAHGQHQPLIDNVGISDNQASARWNTDGSLSAWWCSSEVFPSNGQRHDAIFTATVQPGQSELDPQVALHSAGDDSAKHDRWNSANLGMSVRPTRQR